MRRLYSTLVAGLIVLAVGPLASARAEGPTLTLSKPSQGARINEVSPTYSGTTTDGFDPVKVEILAGAGLGGEKVGVEALAIPVGSGWSTQAGMLPHDGLYTVIARQEEAGIAGLPAEATFTLDTADPTPSLAQPVSPSRNSTPTFTWTPGSAEGDLAPVTLKVLNNKGEIVREGVSSDGSWAVAASEPLADGAYTASVEQSDEAGNKGTESRNFTLDHAAQSVSIGSPADGAHLKSAKPSFSGSAGNLSTDGETVTLNIYKGTQTTGTPEPIPIQRNGGSWMESQGPSLADGIYTAQVVQEDAAGFVGEAKHTFTIETNTPHVTLNSLPLYTNNATPSFGGAVDTTKGAVDSVTLRVFRGASAAESAEAAEPPVVVSGAGSTWNTGATEHLADGTYTAQAEQENLAGTPGFSEHTTFIVDTTAPHPTLSAASESTGLETVSGAGGIAPGDRKQVTAELFQGAVGEPGQAYETITVNATADGAWSATFAGLPSGEYSVLARQSDEAGNTGSSAPQSFRVLAPTGTPTSPSAAPSPPLASFTWVPVSPTVGQVVSFASSSTGGSSPLAGFGWDLGSGQFVPAGPLATTSFATPGAHVVRLQVADASGLSSVATHTINVAAQALKLMQPFPIVRIAGSETASGARVKLLTVQAPPATKVAVSCKGPGCKTKAESRIASASSKSRSKAGAIMLAFPRFQRALKAGAVLQIRVSKAGEIGKFTSFTIRRNKLPSRVDACLRPPSSTPSPCPSQ
jgi:Bacterial Ig-like domain